METTKADLVEHLLGRMTKDKRTLLLYLESRAVDNGGLVDARRMNADDIQIAKQWADDKFIRFSRIPTEFWGVVSDSERFVVELSPMAWGCAGSERRDRGWRLQNSDIVQASLRHFEALQASGACV